MFWKQKSAVLFSESFSKRKRRCDIWYNSFYLLGNFRWGPETPPSNSKIWIFPDFFLKEEYGTIQNIDCDFAKIINIFIGCVRFPHRNNWCYIGSNLSKTSKFQSWVHFSLSWFRRYVYNYLISCLFKLLSKMPHFNWFSPQAYYYPNLLLLLHLISKSIFFLKIASNFFSDTGLRVHSSSNENDKDHPLLVVVKQEKGILSWQIPFFIKREDARWILIYCKKTTP